MIVSPEVIKIGGGAAPAADGAPDAAAIASTAAQVENHPSIVSPRNRDTESMDRGVTAEFPPGVNQYYATPL